MHSRSTGRPLPVLGGRGVQKFAKELQAGLKRKKKEKSQWLPRKRGGKKQKRRKKEAWFRCRDMTPSRWRCRAGAWTVTFLTSVIMLDCYIPGQLVCTVPAWHKIELLAVIGLGSISDPLLGQPDKKLIGPWSGTLWAGSRNRPNRCTLCTEWPQKLVAHDEDPMSTFQ